VSDRWGANGGLDSPASTAPSGAAGLGWGSDRGARRPGLRSFPRHSRRGNRDRTPAPCGLLASCRAGRGRDNNPLPAGHDLGAARPSDGSGRRRRGPRSRARAFHRRGAGGPRRRAGRPCCSRGLGRSRSRRSRGGGRLGLRRARREQAQRVEVAVRLGRHSDSEVDVRLGMLDLSARADGADALTLLDRGADPDAHGPEMDERDRVAVLGADRHAEPCMRHRAGECDHAACGCAHVGPREPPDVHAAVLPAQVRIVLGEKALEHRAVDGPAPRPGRRCEDECCHRGEQLQGQPVAKFENHEPAR